MKRIFKLSLRFALPVFLFILNSNANAATINADSCSLSHVQKAISAAVKGDIVSIPAGSCTWSGGVTIDKDITVQGAGSTSTTITPSNAGITLFTIYGPCRLTQVGFYFTGTPSGLVRPSRKGWRIDHCKFNILDGGNAIFAMGSGYSDLPAGLIDNNVFTDTKVRSHGTSSGDAANRQWNEDAGLGNSDCVYIEDNKFTRTQDGNNVLDAQYSGGTVFRFNTLVNAEVMTHGQINKLNRSPRRIEIYHNNISSDATVGGIVPIYLRGGEGVIFNNTITGSWDWMDEILFSFDRSFSGYGLPICDGTREYDGNEPGESGWLCRDQIGAGRDSTLTVISGGPYTATPPDYGYTYSWGNQTRAPMYAWGNSTKVVPNGDSARHIKENRDFYDGYGLGVQTSPTSPFNGTSGVGRGTYANRPTTCTKGVAYWATDRGSWNRSGSGGQGQLFKCTATNNWTLWYEPYIYPHPLRTGETSPNDETSKPNSPTNLRIEQ